MSARRWLGDYASGRSRDEPTVTARAILSSALKVYFDTGNSEIGPEAKAAIQSAAAALAKNSSTKIDLTGYTDKTGDTAINEELSKNGPWQSRRPGSRKHSH